MKTEDQREAITESLGIEIKQILPNGEWFGTISTGHWQRIANYPEDLNAMHAAEEYLLNLSDGEPMPDIFERYAQKLLVVKYRSDGNLLKLGSNILHATAAEKAEAYLRTLNLWKE